jgi:hypothetical protein
MKTEQTPSSIGESLASGRSIRIRGVPEQPAESEEIAPIASGDRNRRRFGVLLTT